MKKPNLFIVGAPKSGTTSLHVYLSQHPDIFMSEEKEPWHFCRDLYDECFALHGDKAIRFKNRFIVNRNDYLELFSTAKNESILGESTPTYIYSSVAAKEIHKFNPKAKIIVMIREPVSFLHSLHSQLYLRTEESVGNFKLALDLEESRRQGRNIPLSNLCPSSLFYSDKVKYAEHIRRYMNYFDEINIKIIIFDQFVSNVEEGYADVLRFLGVDPEFTPKFRIHNPNEKPRSFLLNRIVLNSHIKNAVQNRMPLSLYNSFVRLSKKLLYETTQRMPLDRSFKIELMNRFKPDVQEISELLNMDLISEWGYNDI